MGKGILLIVAAAVVGGGFAMYNTQQMSQEMDGTISQQHESQILAREMARSGMNVAAGKAHRDWEEAVEQINNAGGVEQDGGSYAATATQTSPTAIDIDVSSTFDASSYRIRRSLVLAGPLDAALVVDAQDAEPVFIDGGFLIDGVDRRPLSVGSAAPTTAMNKPGFKSNAVSVRDQFGNALAGQIHLVQGVIDDAGNVGGGSLKAESTWEIDLDDLYDEAVNYPFKQTLGGTLDGGSLGLTLGSPSDPVVAHVTSNAVVTGVVTGYGMLIVDGDLTVTDQFTWEGIVLVRDEGDDLYVNYGGDARIYGSLISMQRGDDEWAFTMPTEGRLQVTYKYSSAGFGSEVWLDPWGLDDALLFERGSNRDGDQMDVYDVVFPQGQRVNFFINVEGCETGTTSCSPKLYWDHYATGHVAPGGQPYGEVEQTGPYEWEIRFEDLPEGHPWEDWDYNDQVITVEIIPEDGSYVGGEPWWQEPVEGETVGGTSTAANTFHYTMTDEAEVLYSAEAIARLGTKLSIIRNATRVVVVDNWESDDGAEATQ